MHGRLAAPARSWPRRIGWFILLWAAGVLALAVVAGLFRIVMSLAGMTA